MVFNNIDAPGEGNRRARRAVAVIQRKAGAERRNTAAQVKRQRKMAHQFSRNLGKTIVFYDMHGGGVSVRDPDGAYLNPGIIDGRRQIVIAGPLKASIEHYVKAIGIFLKRPMRLTIALEMDAPPGTDRIFTSMIVEPAE